MGTKRRYTPEEIIGKLREAEVLTSQGHTFAETCRMDARSIPDIRMSKIFA